MKGAKIQIGGEETHSVYGDGTLATSTCGAVAAVRELDIDGRTVIRDNQTEKVR
jgi:hypothetical protein